MKINTVINYRRVRKRITATMTVQEEKRRGERNVMGEKRRGEKRRGEKRIGEKRIEEGRKREKGMLWGRRREEVGHGWSDGAIVTGIPGIPTDKQAGWLVGWLAGKQARQKDQQWREN